MKEGWKKNTIGEIAFFQSGSRPKGGVGMIKEGVLSLGGEHIGTDGYVSISTPKYVSLDYYTNNPKGHIEGNDILLCKDGALTGKVAIVRKELKGVKAMINEHVFIIRSKLLLQKYLYYFLFSPNGQIQLKSRISGAAQGGLNGANLKTVSIPYPIKIEAQQRIVEELDLLSSIIEKKEEQLKELDNLAQSIFYDMFGDPVTNEKGWEKKKIGELASVKTGPFGSMLHKEDYISKGIPLVNPIHIKDFHIVADMDFTISDEKAEELNKYILQKDDVVFARRGDIGRCAVVSEEENGYLCGTGSLFVRFIVEVASTYIMYIIRSSSFTKELISNAKGATMLNLNSSIIENLWLPLPPISLQQQFASKIETIEQQKELVKQSIKEVETLFNSRMDYYFN